MDRFRVSLICFARCTYYQLSAAVFLQCPLSRSKTVVCPFRLGGQQHRGPSLAISKAREHRCRAAQVRFCFFKGQRPGSVHFCPTAKPHSILTGFDVSCAAGQAIAEPAAEVPAAGTESPAADAPVEPAPVRLHTCILKLKNTRLGPLPSGRRLGSYASLPLGL